MHVIFYKIAKCYHTRCYPDTANAHCRTILTLLLQLHACSIVSMVIKKLVSLLLCHTYINIHLPSQPGYDAQDLISLLCIQRHECAEKEIHSSIPPNWEQCPRIITNQYVIKKV